MQNQVTDRITFRVWAPPYLLFTQLFKTGSDLRGQNLGNANPQSFKRESTDVILVQHPSGSRLSCALCKASRKTTLPNHKFSNLASLRQKTNHHGRLARA